MSDFFSDDIINYLEEKIKHNKTNYAHIFDDLKKHFNQDKINECINYILSNSIDIKLLDKTIREINKKRAKENLPALIDFLFKPYKHNAYYDLKVLAIKTISNYKDKSAVSPLLYCLNDKNSNYKIRLAAAEALGNIGDNMAFESLSKVVNDEKENSAYIKESAVIALGMLKDNRALDIFDSIINSKQMFLDKFSYLKERIVEAIAKLDISKEKKALEILKKTLFDYNPRVRISAIETLMDSEIAESWELIYDRLKFDDDIEVKKNALVALYNISDRKILDEVINNNFDEQLKIYAKEIIEKYEND